MCIGGDEYFFLIFYYCFEIYYCVFYYFSYVYMKEYLRNNCFEIVFIIVVVWCYMVYIDGIESI